MTAQESGNKLVARLRRYLMTAPAERADEEGPQGWVVTFCILASLLLWFTFSMRETYTRTLEVPLRVVNLEEGAALVTRPPATARVQVVGEGIQLLRLYYNPTAIPVDASQETLDMEVAAAEAITGVRVETIIPRVVSLQQDRRITKRVPLQSRVSVVPPPGHHVIGTPEIRPDSVTIEGAESVIANVTSWPTRRLQVQPEADTVAVQVSLADTLSQLVSVDVPSTLFTASVREFTEGERDVRIVVIGAPPGEVQFDPPTVRVIYQVALDQYDAALEAEDFYAEVSYAAMRADTTGSIVPGIHLPGGIEFREYRLEPPTLGYFLEVLFD
ncbi:MAG: hypothetical protein JJ896_08055 [Rhodothermales bacterium]|nr:hypothetical protein [Rhodothermales bacterium]MBO6779594.1 hypothetical protein [Rhodothermales bacterium]